MPNTPPDLNAQERFARSNTRGATALKRRRETKLDVIRPDSLVPASWRRKAGRAGNVIESFYHAFHGVAVGLKEQRNLRIHFVMAAAVTVAGFSFKIDLPSWMALVIVMSLVISCEFINTSLEHLVDISANGEYHAAARCAKDTAAAAVLCVSVAALAIGAMVFGPRLLLLLGF